MKVHFSKKEIKEVTLDLIRKNKIKAGYIRPIAFYGQKMGLSPIGSPLHLAIAIWPWTSYFGDKLLKVKISPFIRLHPESIVSSAKISGYYINSIFATLDAARSGFDEALLLDYQGYIAEGPGENFFMVKSGKIFTPKLGTMLPGITRKTVIKLARDLGMKVAEKKIRPGEAEKADELFFTGTAAEVAPITQLDNAFVNKGNPGPITLKLREFYLNIVHGKVKSYRSWLTFVN
jgi:branched-chain amino acid aminotransferase